MASLEGRELLGRGRAAEVYAWDDGRALRLMLPPAGPEDAGREATAMRAAAEAGVPVPAIHEVLEVDGRAAIVMDRVHGGDGLDLLSSHPWKVRSVARAIAAAHAQIASTPAPDQLPTVHDAVEQALRSDLVPSELATAATATLHGLPAGETLCHGDLHPGNVLMGPSGPVIIDWTGARRGPAAADHAFALVLVRAGEAPPDSPVVLRALIRLLRTTYARAYATAFRDRIAVDEGQVRRWQGVLAAARLGEGIEEERERMLALAAEHLLGPSA